MEHYKSYGHCGDKSAADGEGRQCALHYGKDSSTSFDRIPESRKGCRPSFRNSKMRETLVISVCRRFGSNQQSGGAVGESEPADCLNPEAEPRPLIRQRSPGV